MRRAIISSACRWPITRWFSVSARFSTVSISFFTMRPTGMPVQSATTRGDGLLVDARQDQRRLALQRGQLRLQRRRARASSCCALRRRRRRGSAACRRGGAGGLARSRRRRRLLQRRCPCLRPARRPRAACARMSRIAIDQLAARPSSAASSSASRCSLGAPAVSSAAFAALGCVDADRLLAADDLELGLQRLDRPAAVLELGRHRVLADRDARAGRVEQADRLVGQLARRDVAVRQPHRRLERLVEHLHAVVLLEHRRHAAQHQDRLLLARLADLHDLEAARQRRVLLDVLLVLGPGRRGDRAQRAARQRRLQQVGRVAGARPRRRRRSACAPRR